MDFETIDSLRDRHPAWRLLRAGNAALVLSFLGQHFVERNQGATHADPGPARSPQHRRSGGLRRSCLRPLREPGEVGAGADRLGLG